MAATSTYLHETSGVVRDYPIRMAARFPELVEVDATSVEQLPELEPLTDPQEGDRT